MAILTRQDFEWAIARFSIKMPNACAALPSARPKNIVGSRLSMQTIFLTLYELTQIQMNHDRYIYQVYLPVVTHFELPQLAALHH